MSILYVTLWLITSGYAAPLGFYGSGEACATAAGAIHLAAKAQVVCVPSEAAMPLALNYRSQPPPVADTTTAPATPATAVDSANVATEGVPFVGSPTAPVTMAYWYDYQCPFCRQVEETVIARLMSEYVQTGKLRILFKNYAFLGPDSVTAALASAAVWEAAPEKFYEWHKAMFDAQGPENSGWATKDKIIALTKAIPGIDSAKVEALMTGHAADFQKTIDADTAEGNAAGVNGTPGAVIGKRLIVGAEDYQQFKTDIDETLSAK